MRHCAGPSATVGLVDFDVRLGPLSDEWVQCSAPLPVEGLAQMKKHMRMYMVARLQGLFQCRAEAKDVHRRDQRLEEQDG